ncbi:MAG: signal peptidase II [Candidatus Omnitrophica bacterium]|nr:signal peptidase II [Candidatus Omnitrophota bacterium]
MKGPKRSQTDIVISLLITFTVVAIDRLTKSFFANLLFIGETIPVIKKIFHLTLVHNTGIAFGFFKDQGIVFIVIPIFLIILLIFNVYYYRQNNQALSRLYIIAFSLILGGAIGNLIDRIAFGYVIDFLDFMVWPVFNVADSAITIGASLVAFECFQLKR